MEMRKQPANSCKTANQSNRSRKEQIMKRFVNYLSRPEITLSIALAAMVISSGVSMVLGFARLA